MQSRTNRKFWGLFHDLPLDVQQDARRAWRLFQSNPAHPSLHFKKLEGEDDIYSARIGLQYRALAVVEKATSFGTGSAVTQTTTVWSDNGRTQSDPATRHPREMCAVRRWNGNR